MAFKQSAPVQAPPQVEVPVKPAYESVLPAKSVFRGDFETEGSVLIDGSVDGNVKSINGDIMLGKSAKVTGNIESSGITVEGVVNGNLKVAGKVTLRGGASVSGDITSNALYIDAGVSYEGTVCVGKNTPERAAAPVFERAAAGSVIDEL